MGSIFFLLLVIAVLMVLASSYTSGRQPRQRVQPMERPVRRAVRSSTSSAAAAMRRAGYPRGEGYVDVTDVGVLAYRGADQPKLVRSGNVAADTEYLRPFIELWLPYLARGSVRFELLDETGRLRYADEAAYDLNRGRSTLLPSTWLPLQGKPMTSGQWTLRVQAGETLLADHAFGWQEIGGSDLQPLIDADGEISPELLAAVRAEGSVALSLNDLLAGQDE